MSGLRIVIDDADIMERLSQLERAARNPAQAMKEVAAALLQSTRRRFETHTAPDGQKWQRLSPRTAAKRVSAKRKRGFERILRVTPDTGLYGSLTTYSDATTAIIGSNKQYASIHQFGGEVSIPERQQTIHMATRKGRNRFVRANSRLNSKRSMDVKIKAHKVVIPARPYLGINDEDKAEILQTIEDHFRREAGLVS